MIVKEPFDDYTKNKEWINPSSFKSEDIRTPKHFLHWYQNQKEDTTFMKVGRALHIGILEPEKFEKEYAYLDTSLFPSSCKKTTLNFPDLGNKYNKLIYDEYKEKNPNKTILNFAETKTVRGMIYGMKEDIKDLYKDTLIDLKNGLIEPSIYLFAEFDEYGKFVGFLNITVDDAKKSSLAKENRLQPIKTRPDYFTLVHRFALDIKNTQCADKTIFSYDVVKYGYYMQSAFILDCLNCEYPNKVDSYEYFIFICIESKPPYCAIKFLCSPDMIKNGREDYQARLSFINKCFKSKHFAGYDIFSNYKTFDENFTEKENGQTIDLDLPSSYYRKKEKMKEEHGKIIW